MLRASFRLLLCLASCLALQLHAATAKDIQGEWTVDGPATWAAMKSAPQFAALPPEQQPAIEQMMLKQMSSMGFTLTADKLISSQGDQKKEETYKVTSIDGDKLVTESTDAAGKVEKSEITVKGDTLLLASLDQPGMKMVLKRKGAAK